MFPSIQLPPPAALDDILNVVIPLILMSLYAVGQMMAAKKQAQRRGPRQIGRGKQGPMQAGPLPADPLGPARGKLAGGKIAGGKIAGQPAGLEADLRREVDEFLRRARGEEVRRPSPPGPETGREKMPRQGRAQQRKRTAMGRKAERPELGRTGLERGTGRETGRSLSPQATGQRPSRQRPGRLVSPSGPSAGSRGGPPATAMQPEPSAGHLRNQGVGEHVAAHIDRGMQAIGQHAERLATSLEHTDERTQRRIEKKFEHQVGRLQHQQGAAIEEETVLAEEIANLFRSPDGIRQMILAKEILSRPFP